jgi:hypothetical protein
MAVVQGIKEKVHLPIYDCFKVEPKEQLGDVEKSSTLKFFIDVQRKTKLLTNLQSASLLPHYNTFEARALRVVLSDLPPEFPSAPDVTGTIDGLEVSQADPNDPTNDIPFLVDDTGAVNATPASNVNSVSASADLGLDRIVELLTQARDSSDGTVDISPTEEGVSLSAEDSGGKDISAQLDAQDIENAGGFITLSTSDLESALATISDTQQPLDAQLEPNNGAGTILSKIIYNTVTTLYVGEKVMIEMPTWFFPAGAGPYSEGGTFSTHGEPNPMATFRFAEPIFIDRQQNFRVEIDVPDKDILDEIQRIYGPLFIWVVLDGFMTRGVQ